MLIFLIGVRGAGKSSCLDALRSQHKIKVLVPSTTRPPRDLTDVEYDFRTAFDVPMAWAISVGENLYGMRQSELDSIDGAVVGLTVFEPDNIHSLIKFRQNSHHEVLIVALDTIQTDSQQVIRVHGALGRKQSQADIDRQRSILEEHADLILRGTLAQNVEAIGAALLLLRSRGGVIDRRTIKSFSDAGTLLQGSELTNIQSASYDLRLGGQLLFDGGVVQLTDQSPSFSIPQYSFVIVEAQEKAELPRFISARFDLRVSYFMKGMILSNGPQVDPGFQGALFCMLYNASDEPIRVKKGDHFATVEFHTTALSTTGNRTTNYHAFRGLQALSADILERPGSKLLSRIESVAEQATKAWGRWSIGLGIWVALLLGPAAWSLSILSDTNKANQEMSGKIREAEELIKRLNSELESFQNKKPRVAK